MDPKNLKKTYTNGEVTIVWNPGNCIHSALCWKFEDSLPEVFNPRAKPWINADGADTERIIEQVKKCPSGALSYYMNNETGDILQESETKVTVEVKPAGPLLVHGNIRVREADGTETVRQNITAFCRCGHSASKPFCDGSHRKTGFVG